MLESEAIQIVTCALSSALSLCVCTRQYSSHNTGDDGRMAASVIPSFKESSDVDVFLELMTSYFFLNKTKDEGKIHALVMGLGQETYTILRDLLSPRLPTDVSFTEAAKVLRDHYRRPRNKMQERASFREMRRTQGMRVHDFMAQLRGKAAHCAFGAQLEENLLEQFRIGVHSRQVEARLLQLSSQDQVSLDKVLAAALDVEVQGLVEEKPSVVQQVSAGHARGKERSSMAQFGHARGKEQGNPKEGKYGEMQCYRCLRRGHAASSPMCSAKGKMCRSCGLRDHFAGSKFCKASAPKLAHKGPRAVLEKAGARATDKPAAANHRGTGDHAAEDGGQSALEGGGQPRALDQPSQNVDTDELFRVQRSGQKDPPMCTVKVAGESIDMIVDTGACVNIIDSRAYSRLVDKVQLSSCREKQLFAFGSEGNLPMMGMFEGEVTFDNCSTVADFYVFEGEAECLLSYSTAKSLGLLSVHAQVYAVTDVADSKLEKCDLMLRYPSVFAGVGKLEHFQAKLHIDKTVTPVAQPVRRLPLAYRDKVEGNIQQMLADDIIEPVEGVPTGWVSPLVCVMKDSGEIRQTVDMRQANAAILRERHPIPSVKEMLAGLEGSKVFSKVDLKQGFHQVVLEEESRDITTFVSPFGLYRYKRISMGINAAPELFQYAIQRAIAGLEGVQNLADDIIVAGKDQKEHNKRVHALMKRLSEVGLTLNPRKCEFGLKSVKFLGFVISSEGVSPDPEKVRAIADFRAPSNPTDCRSFLGLVNFVGRFVPGLATITEPIKRVTHKHEEFVWGEEQEASFQEVKRRMSRCETLAHFDPKAPTKVVADASPYGLGCVLTQVLDGVERVITYGHRSLSAVERRYSQTERESLALVWACEHLQMYLLGSVFTLVTDHKPLEFIFGNKQAKPTPRVERWALRMQSFRYHVVYEPGRSNIADPLSRLAVSPETVSTVPNVADEYIRMVAREATPSALSWDEIVGESAVCEEMSSLSKGIEKCDFTGCGAGYKSVRAELATTCDGVNMRGNRIIIPVAQRRRVLELAHEGHQGVVRTKQRLRSSVWWPGIDREAEKLCSECDVCVRVSAPNPPAPLTMSKMPQTPWEFLAVDLLGPLPNGQSIIVLVDYYSRYIEAAFLRSTSAEKVVEFLDTVFSRFGMPKALRSDNGPQFVSSVFQSYLSSCAIRWVSTTPVWAQGNGMVERANQGILKSLRIAHANGEDMGQELRRYLLAYRSTPHASTGVAPFSLLMGRQMRTKLPSLDVQLEEDIHERARESDSLAKTRAKEYADSRRRAQEPDVSVGDLVYLRQRRDNKLDAYFGKEPFKVISKEGTDLVCRGSDGATYRRNVTYAKRCPEGAMGPVPDRVQVEEDPPVQNDADRVDQADGPPHPGSKRKTSVPVRFNDFIMR